MRNHALHTQNLDNVLRIAQLTHLRNHGLHTPNLDDLCSKLPNYHPSCHLRIQTHIHGILIRCHLYARLTAHSSTPWYQSQVRLTTSKSWCMAVEWVRRPRTRWDGGSLRRIIASFERDSIVSDRRLTVTRGPRSIIYTTDVSWQSRRWLTKTHWRLSKILTMKRFFSHFRAGGLIQQFQPHRLIPNTI